MRYGPAILAVLTLVLVSTALVNSTSLPEVRWSFKSKQCVAVVEFVEPKKGWTCDNLPKRFDKVWVE